MISTNLNQSTALRGHYSLIQFCPNSTRLEVANIGVALFCAEQEYFDVKLSKDHRRITQMFGRGDRDLIRLRTNKTALEEKLRDTKHSLRNIEDLQKLASLQVNQLRMTEFMPCRVMQSPTEYLDKLFQELVSTDTPTIARESNLFPRLEALFSRLTSEGRAEVDYRAKLPVLDHEFKVPFAYRNGVLNLVKPKQFNQNTPQQVLDLAIRGDLIKRHGVHGEPDCRLVVVSKFKPGCDPAFESHVDDVFKEYHVKHVRQSEIEAFAFSVEAEAQN